MQGVLEMYDTLRSACIPAACYAVGKMEANQQGSAFSMTALWICRETVFVFLSDAVFVHMQHRSTSEIVCFLREINQMRIGYSCAR